MKIIVKIFGEYKICLYICSVVMKLQTKNKQNGIYNYT